MVGYRDCQDSSWCLFDFCVVLLGWWTPLRLDFKCRICSGFVIQHDLDDNDQILSFFFWVCTTIYLCIYNQNTALTCFLAFTTRNNRDLTNCCYCVIKLRHSFTDFRNARPMSLYFLPLLPRTKPLWIVMRLYDSMYIAPSSHLSMFCVHMAVFMKTLGSLCPSDPHEDCCKIERSPINEVIANL